MDMSINKTKKYLAAVSGGPDSMFMLYLLKDKICGVCHVNYQKRETANRDMAIVKNFCESNKIKFYCLKVNKKILNQYTKNNSNFQNAARLIRYDFFIKCANSSGTNRLLIGHNKDDFLETALMQKQRHSQTLFLGIRDINIYKSLYIARPLLECWKSQIL
jgi:tRNA(Ile)-lysidine synthase